MGMVHTDCSCENSLRMGVDGDKDLNTGVAQQQVESMQMKDERGERECR